MESIRFSLIRRSSILASNPVSAWYSLPDFDKIKAEHVVPAVQAVIEDASNIVSTVEALERPSLQWNDMMPQMEKALDAVDRAGKTIFHLAAVNDSAELREAHRQAQSDMITFGARVEQSKALFSKYKQVQIGTCTHQALFSSYMFFCDGSSFFETDHWVPLSSSLVAPIPLSQF